MTLVSFALFYTLDQINVLMGLISTPFAVHSRFGVAQTQEHDLNKESGFGKLLFSYHL